MFDAAQTLVACVLLRCCVSSHASTGLFLVIPMFNTVQCLAVPTQSSQSAAHCLQWSPHKLPLLGSVKCLPASRETCCPSSFTKSGSPVLACACNRTTSLDSSHARRPSALPLSPPAACTHTVTLSATQDSLPVGSRAPLLQVCTMRHACQAAQPAGGCRRWSV